MKMRNETLLSELIIKPTNPTKPEIKYDLKKKKKTGLMKTIHQQQHSHILARMILKKRKEKRKEKSHSVIQNSQST